MHYALVEQVKLEAQPDLKGICPGCAAAVIAKCGTERVWHWAHVSGKGCDNWWEPETEWHRGWKGNFPAEWQEYFLTDGVTGERHVADVRTSHDLVIEFQHSRIHPDERLAREHFYQTMVWVVDCTGRDRDRERLSKKGHYFKMIKPGLFRVSQPERFFPGAWMKSVVPVIFDFGEDTVYCLFPGRVGRKAIVAEVSFKTFIRTTHSDEWLLRMQRFVADMEENAKKWEREFGRAQDDMDTKVERLLAGRHSKTKGW